MVTNGNWAYLVSEAKHFVARNARMFVAKSSAMILATFSTKTLNGGATPPHGVHAEGMFHAVSEWLERSTKIAAAETIGRGLLFAVVGLISAAMVQLDYRHWIEDFISLYQNELSTKLGKSPVMLSEKDVYMLANGDTTTGIRPNRTFFEHVNKLQSTRTISMAISIMASFIALLVGSLILATPAIAPVVTHINGLLSGASPVVAKLPLVLAEATLCLAVYNAAKLPMHWVAQKLFRGDHETIHDHIAKMQRDRNDGQVISRERVLEVFANANPRLSNEDISRLVPLDDLTADINSGQFRITELAFTVQGQTSAPNRPLSKTEPGLVGSAFSCLGKAFHSMSRKTVEQRAAAPAPSPTMECDNPQPSRSFVDRLNTDRLLLSTRSRDCNELRH